MQRPLDLLSFNGISCMAFNKDYSLCCVSHKDKNLYIYKVYNSLEESSKWELQHTLKEVTY